MDELLLDFFEDTPILRRGVRIARFTALDPHATAQLNPSARDNNGELQPKRFVRHNRWVEAPPIISRHLVVGVERRGKRADGNTNDITCRDRREERFDPVTQARQFALRRRVHPRPPDAGVTVASEQLTVGTGQGGHGGIHTAI